MSSWEFLILIALLLAVGLCVLFTPYRRSARTDRRESKQVWSIADEAQEWLGKR
jgi:hypothetical protein